MPTVDVVDLNRRKVGSAELPAEIFGCKPHMTLVHEAVVMQQQSRGQKRGVRDPIRRPDTQPVSDRRGSFVKERHEQC